MNSATLQPHLDRYLEIRRACGFAMHAEERFLTDFLRYADTHPTCPPAAERLAVDWACVPKIRAGSGHHAKRLSVARGFLTYLQSSVPEIRVPGPGLVRGARRPNPYIFSPAEVDQLLKAAQSLGPHGSLRPFTYYTLIGLLLSCGLRAGEALRLTCSDVVLETDIPHLVVRHTKFRKSRFVPMHQTAADSMRAYTAARQRLVHQVRCDSFFVSEEGAPLLYGRVNRTFRTLKRRIGIPSAAGLQSAGLHSLRHTFAVSRMLHWYREGIDVMARLPELSVFLGHVQPQESYWYLTATPELLSAAAARFEFYGVSQMEVQP